MPVYNADNYLDASINSILNQTYKNFEFIIVCSDPTKTTEKILEKYSSIDPRILVFYQEKKGIIFARNFGCQLARGEFIAVMDADDISGSNRFETQLLFMEKNPDIGILGSWADRINDRGIVTNTIRYPTRPFGIGWCLIFENCMMHLTILMRKSILKDLQYYSHEKNGFPEDYDLWTRAFFVTKIANLPIVLSQSRAHLTNNSISVKYEMTQFDNILRNEFLQKLFKQEFQNFLKEAGLQMNSDIFTFNIDCNDKQVRFIEDLYRLYIHRYDVTPQDLMEIRSSLAIFLLRYSFAMVRYSKKRALILLCKSIHYLNSISFEIIIRALWIRLKGSNKIFIYRSR